MPAIRHAVICAITFLVTAARGIGAVGPPPEELLEKVADPPWRELDRVGEEMKNGFGDWSLEAARARAATHRLWERNGWKDEADQFALQLMDELNQIPPWEVSGRWETLSNRLTDRYHLTPDQKQRMENLIYQESLTFFVKHARTIIDHTRGIMGARTRGEPFTPEQVARWASESEPLLSDGFSSARRITEQVAADMTPEQRATLERDWSSFDRRMQYVEKLRPEWAKGHWQPQDWGMEDDPIQNGSGLGADQKSGTGVVSGPARDNTHLLPWDETTWHVYVRQFAQDYRLDAAQKASADSVLSELVDRAAQYRRDHSDVLSAVP
ncbi:MAG TPA: hypothetical protein VGM03_12165, partial [Phycisphaerae bacterium]